jgi:hypothetical protein
LCFAEKFIGRFFVKSATWKDANAKNRQAQILQLVFALLFVCLLLIGKKASASEGDFAVVQRGGTSYNKGNLSRDPRYPTYSLASSHSIYTNVGKLGLEIANVFSLSHSTFYTLKKPELAFPLIAKAPHQLFEPAFLYNACFFVYSRIRPCFAGGISAVYIRHNAQNYTMNAGFPVQARLQLVGPSGIFVEGGATLRRFSQRTEGELAWSQDMTVFFGFGLILLSQF